MDDFEKEYPDFDWKNIPAYKHPGGRNCPCPKHEYIREQIRFTRIYQHTNILVVEIVHVQSTNTLENRFVTQNK